MAPVAQLFHPLCRQMLLPDDDHFLQSRMPYHKHQHKSSRARSWEIFPSRRKSVMLPYEYAADNGGFWPISLKTRPHTNRLSCSSKRVTQTERGHGEDLSGTPIRAHHHLS
jgi:hypothetical protein